MGMPAPGQWLFLFLSHFPSLSLLLLYCYSIATYVYYYLLNPAPKRTNEEAQPEAAKKPRIEVGPLLLSAQISLFLLFLLLDI